MADGHFSDVELLRRELAVLILEWAGKAAKEDPDGPMSTALSRAVSQAAREAVAEQHQVLAADAADRIAEALDRRDRAAGLIVWRARPWSLGVVALAAAALLAAAFLLGSQTRRTGDALPAEPAQAAAPVAPLAPNAEEPARSASTPHTSTPRAEPSRPATRALGAAPPPVKPAARPAPRELGRPAPAADQSSPRANQPVGAAATSPPAPTGATTP